MIPSEIRNKAGERIDYTFHPGEKPDKLVVLGHGVTGNKDRPLLIAIAEGLSAKGWPCLRISYSGNGNSEGCFADSNISKETRDLTAVLESVPDGVKIAYIGHSMGAAAGVLTATSNPRINVLVSLAGMTRTAEFVEREFGDVTPGEGFMWDDESCPLSKAYVDDLRTIGSTLKSAAKVTQPWLLIHGSADDVVPVSDGISAHAAATSRKRWLEIGGAAHAFDPASYPIIVDAADDWLTGFL